MLLDSVNLSWVACWADALDLPPSIECIRVEAFLSPSTEQFVAKFSATSSAASGAIVGFTDTPSFT